MIYVKPRSPWESESVFPANDKTFSYYDVERILVMFTEQLNNLQLVKENDLTLICSIDDFHRGVNVIAENTEKACVMKFDLEDK